jgi:uncharacterized protein
MSDMRPTTQGIFPAVMTETYANESSQAFWDAAKQDKLVAPKCTECGTFRLPPSPFCFKCRNRAIAWTELPGTGTVYSFTIVRHALSPGLSPAVPYAAGVVELDGTQGAGARMIVNIIECDVESLKIGDKVEVVFEHIAESVTEMAVPRFRPIKS